MNRVLTILVLGAALVGVCASVADAQRERPGTVQRHDQPLPPPRQGILPPPGIVLWPPEARMQQVFRLQGDDLRQALRSHPELGQVTCVRIVDYLVPGPPTSSAHVLVWYDRNLKEPDWREFYRNSVPDGDITQVAYKGPAGFVAVIARPNGATVSNVEGRMELSDMPVLEKLIREGVARRPLAPVEARDRIDAADRLRAAGKFDDAIEALRTVITDYPQADMAHLVLARTLAEQGKSSDEAAREFRQAIQLAPMNPDHRMEYARFLIDRGDLENAEYELQQAAAMDPWSPSRALALGHVLEKRGKLKDAEAWVRKAIERSAPPEAYVDLGRILEAQGRGDEALQAYKDALKLRPDLQPARDGVRRLEKPAQ